MMPFFKRQNTKSTAKLAPEGSPAVYEPGYRPSSRPPEKGAVIARPQNATILCLYRAMAPWHVVSKLHEVKRGSAVRS
jgi:hypothetical protein